METFSALLAICAGNSPAPGEFPTQRPVTRSFDVYFDKRPNKRLSKQSWGWWFETLSHPFWRHRNVRQCYWILTANDLVAHPGGSGLSSSWLYWGPKKKQIHDDVIERKHFRVTGLCYGNPPVTGGLPSSRPMMRNLGVFFQMRLNKPLSKHSRQRWRHHSHYDVIVMLRR